MTVIKAKNLQMPSNRMQAVVDAAKAAMKQILWCEYECEAGPIKNNLAGENHD